jgi:hypothetical protein
MKKILPLITLLIGLFNASNAQTDYCQDITKDAKPSIVIYDSPTPGDKKEGVKIFAFRKIINENGTHTYLRIGYALSDGDIKTPSVVINFEDNDMITYSNVEMRKDKSSIPTDVLYYAVIEVSNDDLIKFKSKKMANYVFGGHKLIPSKDKIMGYAGCIMAQTEGPSFIVNANEKKSIDGFWGIKFGATMDEAKAAVKAKGGKLNAETSKADELHFENVVFTERPVDVLALRFVNGKFYQAVALFPILDEGVVISRFNTIVSELNNVYGPAVITKKFQPPYDTGTGEYDVQAITFGKGLYYATWKTNNKNDISLEIAKDLHFNLFYTDTTLAKEKTTQKSSDY